VYRWIVIRTPAVPSIILHGVSSVSTVLPAGARPEKKGEKGRAVVLSLVDQHAILRPPRVKKGKEESAGGATWPHRRRCARSPRPFRKKRKKKVRVLA